MSVAIALVYLVAFLSLLVQVKGLLGSGGILPVGDYLAAVRQATGGGVAAWWRVPTVLWLDHRDGALVALCLAGAGASILLAFDVAPLAAAAVAWGLYLSLDAVGQDFLAFQWDTLLLEAGFLLLFLVPAGRRPVGRRRPEPWLPAVWLFWWLLFRLILESGMVKLASGDPTWRNLTAVAYHYETQPIPNLVAWYAWHLPLWFQKLSTLVTLVVELAVPFLFLMPRRPRIVGGVILIAQQCLIALTGNFGFFNVLTIAIALCLFDDAFWHRLLLRLPGGLRVVRRMLRGAWLARRARTRSGPPRLVRRVVTSAFLVVAVVVGLGQVVRAAGKARVPGPVLRVWSLLQPFGVLNAYGLFATMTTRRPELVVQGRSGDGPWREIDFRWKADALSERPHQVAPYMPRLDWQMWFAALRAERVPAGAPPGVRYDPWFLSFIGRLLEGDPQVWALLSRDGRFREPAGGIRSPDEIRVLLYDYGFTSLRDRAATGNWWKRRKVGEYLPPVRRTRDGSLEIVSSAGDGRGLERASSADSGSWSDRPSPPTVSARTVGAGAWPRTRCSSPRTGVACPP